MPRLSLPFLVLAVSLIAISSWHLHSVYSRADWQTTSIVVDEALQQKLAAEFELSWLRKPDPQELDELVDDYVHEEMAFREGMQRGLGSSDISVRRRVQEVLEASVRQGAGSVELPEPLLRQYLADHPDLFRVDELVSFRHIYFSPGANQIGADAQARFLVSELASGAVPENLADLGDPSPVPLQFVQVSAEQLEPLFGGDFVAELARLDAGRWSGPLRSRLGLHVVYIDDRGAGRVPAFEQIEDKVRRNYLQHAADHAVEQLYEDLSAKYDIRH